MDLDLSKRSKPCFKKNRMMSMGKVKNPFLKLCGIGLLTVYVFLLKPKSKLYSEFENWSHTINEY